MKGVCHIKRMALLPLLLLAGVVAAVASGDGVRGRNGYSTIQLATMARELNIQTLCDTLGDGVHCRVASFRQLPLTVVVRKGEVRHIGYSVFTASQRAAFSEDVLNFVERYALSLDIPAKRLKTVEKQLDEDKVMFRVGSFRSLPAFIADSTYSLSLQSEMQKLYIVTWSKDGQTVCQLGFPMQYELLWGAPIDEVEQALKRRVMATTVAQADTLALMADSVLTTSPDGSCYVKPGQIYYFDELNSNRYYEKLESQGDGKSIYRLLFDSRHSHESLANVLTTTDVPNSFMLRVRQRTFNYTDSIYEVPLTQWVAYCLQTGCTPFFGIISDDGKVVDCELVMRNADLGYNHVMRLKVGVADIDRRCGLFTARLNAYIPTHNLKYLFNEQMK